MNNTHSKTLILVEGALMIAVATLLSMVKLFRMPYGGSVKLMAMVPLVMMSFRHGIKWGTITAFAYSLLHLVLGINDVASCPTLLSQIGCILLDYVIAYTVLGLADAIAKPFKNRIVGVCVGTGVVCLMRFVCSWLSGILVWGAYQSYYDWAANMPTWLYSLIYNGNYMLPDTVINIIGAAILVKAASRLFDRQSA